MSDSHNIDYILEEIITLPSQPQTLSKITDLMEDPDCSMAEVGKIISADPSIAIKALRLVNSAHYGLRNRVVSIEHAVMLLGLKVIRNLVLSATVFETFTGGTDELLHHCVSTGVVMRILVDTQYGQQTGDIEDVFVYGLLHDVGKIIFQEFLPEESKQAYALACEKNIPSYEAEREVIGCDHAEVGARLAVKWNLPHQLAQAIGGHHDLSVCEDEQAREWAAMLSAADYICYASGMPAAAGVPAVIDDQMWKAAKLTSRTMPQILDRFFLAQEQVQELLEIAQ